MKVISFILLLVLTSLTNLSAQVMGRMNQTEHLEYWEGTVKFGPSVFMGDIKYYRIVPAKSEWRFATGVSFGRRFSALLGLRGTALMGKLAGRQKTGDHRLESRYYEINMSGILYLDNLFGENRFDRFIQPYMVAGIGLVYYNSNLYTLAPGQLVKNSGNKTEGLLLLGLGIDFRLNSQWSVSAESANRGINSDHMDLWVSGYPYDVYNVTTVGVKYRFGFSSRNSPGYYPRKVINRKFHRAF